MSYTFYRVVTNALWPVAVSAAAVRTVTGSPEWRQRVGRMPPVATGALWLHAASVGEVAAVAPLAGALAARPSGVLLTVVSPTGRDAAERSLENLTVSLAPLDFVAAVRRVLRSVAPRALLLTETELWPNTIYESAEAGVPVGMVNGRLSERSLKRYAMLGSPLRGVVPRVSFAACRSEDDAARFRELGVVRERVTAVGDMKFDKLAAPLGDSERSELRASLGIPADACVAVFGSVRPREENAVASVVAAMASEFPGSHAVIAPRHLERVPRVAEALASRGVASRLRSAGGSGDPERRTIIVSTPPESWPASTPRARRRVRRRDTRALRGTRPARTCGSGSASAGGTAHRDVQRLGDAAPVGRCRVRGRRDRRVRADVCWTS